jgi:hypothetical protein
VPSTNRAGRGIERLGLRGVAAANFPVKKVYPLEGNRIDCVRF